MTAKNKLAINKGVFGRTIMAICPKCRELFKTYEDWQGRGIMRKHCPPCKINVNKRTGGLDENSNFSKPAVLDSVRTGRS